ncbi:MAG: DUF998 domain-containing protein [Gammaproteobacteria bacterium]
MWLRFALVSSIVTFPIHLYILLATGLNPVTTPISALSRGDWGALHTLSLASFGLAHLALAVGLTGMDRGRLWWLARMLLGAAGVGLVYLSYYFLSASASTLTAPGASAPLWVVASLTGTAMGALQPGLSRRARGLSIFSAACLGIWLWLVPVFFFVGEDWTGAYERAVGLVYVIWLVCVSLGLSRVGEPQAPN